MIKYDRKVQEEINSPTIVNSFTRLLKRTRDVGTFVKREFKVYLKQLKTRKELYLDSSICTYKNLSWECVLLPSVSDPKSYDLRVRCLIPAAVYNRETSEVGAAIFLFSPGGMFAVEFEESEKILPNVVNETDFKKLDKNQSVKIEMSLEVFESCKLGDHSAFFSSTIVGKKGHFDENHWKTNKKFRRYWRDGIDLDQQEMKLSLPKMITEYFTKLLSESTLKSSHVLEWSTISKHLVRSLNASDEAGYYSEMAKSGIMLLVAKLLAADFTECFSTSITVLRSFVELLTYSPDGLATIGLKSDVRTQLMDAYDEAFVNIVDKFYDKRYRIDLLAFLSVRAIPLLFWNLSSVADTAPHLVLQSRLFLKTVNSSEALLPFLDIRTITTIAHQPGAYLNHLSSACIFFNSLASACYQKRGTRTWKNLEAVLKMLCENHTNPFYCLANIGDPLALYEHNEAEGMPGSTIISGWCQRNRQISPGLIFPATAKIGLNQLKSLVDVVKQGSDGMKRFIKPQHRPFIDILMSNYAIRLDDMTLPEGFVEKMQKNQTSWVKKLETSREAANDLFRRKEYQLAVDRYTSIMADIKFHLTFFRSMQMSFPPKANEGTFTFYTLLDMVSKVRNNRSASYGKLQQWNEALSDSVIVVNEIQSLLSGTHFLFQPPSCVLPPAKLPELENRLRVAKLRRIQFLVSMEEWIPALHNSMDLLIYDKECGKETLAFYYHTLVKYSSTVSVLLFPIFCVSCQDTSREILDLTKFRCKSCRHPFCSEACYQKDPKHEAYCPQLTKLRKSKNFKEFRFPDSSSVNLSN